MRRDRSCAARQAREGRSVRRGAVRRHRARDCVRRAEHASGRAGLLALPTLLERMSAGPARSVRPRAAEDRRQCSRQPRSARHRDGVARDGGRLPLALGKLVAARQTLKGRSRLTVAAGPRRLRGMSVGLTELTNERRRRLCDAGSGNDRGAGSRGRRGVRRPVVGADGVSVREGRVRDGHDRLPGAGHRPELRGADSSASRRRWSETTGSTTVAPSPTAST